MVAILALGQARAFSAECQRHRNELLKLLLRKVVKRRGPGIIFDGHTDIVLRPGAYEKLARTRSPRLSRIILYLAAGPSKLPLREFNEFKKCTSCSHDCRTVVRSSEQIFLPFLIST